MLSKRILAGILLVVVPSALWLCRDNVSLLAKYGPRCVFHDVTHLNCPGCGGTRALILLSHGDVLGSIRMNVLTILFFLCLITSLTKFVIAGKGIDWVGPKGRYGKIIAATFIGFFLLRNVPIVPFKYLAPVSLEEWSRTH